MAENRNSMAHLMLEVSLVVFGLVWECTVWFGMAHLVLAAGVVGAALAVDD